MKRRGATKSRINYAKPNDDKVIISSEYSQGERPSFICSICNRTLSRLTDSGGQNTTYWCRNCSVEFDPELENVRRESKISVPDRNQETLVSTTPGIDYLKKRWRLATRQNQKAPLRPYNRKVSRSKTTKKLTAQGELYHDNRNPTKRNHYQTYLYYTDDLF